MTMGNTQLGNLQNADIDHNEEIILNPDIKMTTSTSSADDDVSSGRDMLDDVFELLELANKLEEGSNKNRIEAATKVRQVSETSRLIRMLTPPSSRCLIRFQVALTLPSLCLLEPALFSSLPDEKNVN